MATPLSNYAAKKARQAAAIRFVNERAEAAIVAPPAPRIDSETGLWAVAVRDETNHTYAFVVAAERESDVREWFRENTLFRPSLVAPVASNATAYEILSRGKSRQC